jgi:hypothetical protein
MPTPFYHLKIVNDLIRAPHLDAQVKIFLTENMSDFLFGNTAPDLQSLNGQARVETHFFSVPLASNWVAEKEVFLAYPELNNLFISKAKKIFLAGYLCHLQADQNWIREIYWPYFATKLKGGSLKKRRLLHDRLRTYLDREALDEIPSNYWELFGLAKTSLQLPFAKDKDLGVWHQYLSKQLQPKAKILTVEVFSKRHGLTELEFESPIEDSVWVEETLLSHLPHKLLVKYHQKVIDENIKLLNNYLYEN